MKVWIVTDANREANDCIVAVAKNRRQGLQAIGKYVLYGRPMDVSEVQLTAFEVPLGGTDEGETVLEKIEAAISELGSIADPKPEQKNDPHSLRRGHNSKGVFMYDKNNTKTH